MAEISDAPPSYNEKNDPRFNQQFQPVGQSSQQQFQPVGQSAQQHQQPKQAQPPQHPSQQPINQNHPEKITPDVAQPDVVGGIPPQPRRFGVGYQIFLYIFCFVVPPISVMLVSPDGYELCLNVVLYFLFGLPGAFHGVYVVYKYCSGIDSYKEWERVYGNKRTTV